MNKYKTLLRDIIIFAIGNLGTKMILFFLVPLYTNFLSTKQYGTVELIDTIANFIIPFTSMAIFDAVLRFTLDKNKERSSVILNAIIILGIGSGTTFILTPFLKFYPSISEWKWFINLYIIFHMSTQIFMTYIKAKEKTRLYVILGLIQTLLLAGLNILFLVFFKLEIYGYLYANILSHLFIIIVSLVKGKIINDLRRACFDKELLKEMVKYSAPLIINNVSWWIIQSSDKIMIDFFVSSVALGLYSVAGKIPALINVIISFFSQAWGISSIKEYDSSKDAEFYSEIFQMYTFVIFSFCISLFIIVKPFMKIYVGKDFFEAWIYIPYLLVAASFSAVSAYFGAIYGALKKSINVMLSTIFSGSINIILNFYLIPKIGVLGATLSTAISYMVIAFYRMLDTRRYFRFKIYFFNFLIESFVICFDAYLIIKDKASNIILIFSLLSIIAINYSVILKILFLLKRGIKSVKNKFR